MLDCLTADEVALLAAYLYDKATQMELAADAGKPRRTIAYRIAAAVRKLNAAGVRVTTPGKGRRRERVELVFCDPEHLDRLLTHEGSGGPKSGRWVDADHWPE